MSSNIAIEKLDGTNFHTWKMKMKMILIREDVWDTVNGETSALASGSNKEDSATALKAWKKADQKALSTIFEAKGLSRKLYLRKRLFTMQMSDSETESYETLIVTLESRPEEDLTAEFVKSRLRQELEEAEMLLL